jgi:hypothetical protein
MVAADKTNEHGGSSTNPPAASPYGERDMITIKMRPDLNLTTSLDGLLLARSGTPENLDAARCEKNKVSV